MSVFLNFFRQQVPKTGEETPYYYQESVKLNDRMLAIYLLISFVVLSVSIRHICWPPAIFLALIVLKSYYAGSISVRLNLLLHSLLVCLWSVWYVINFGWGLGGQHILIVLILLVFFCLYEPPYTKLLYFVVVLVLRLWLYSRSVNNEPLIQLDSFSQFLLQIINTVSLFLIMAGCCIVYSSNLQETERLLLLHNEQLQVQAETDPLTKLINRRGLMDIMARYVRKDPEAMYCVAIADIDFFKRVNDTYGHNCGDHTLQCLSALFLTFSQNRYSVARWGGEEFCFFFPGINIDDASRILTDLMIAVRKMQVEYEGNSFSITLTIGIEENDYRSPLKDLIDSADRKLYRGKQNGRDQIVF